MKAAKVELTWGKKNDTIDFTVKGKNFEIDGFVAREFDSVRYYADSQMTHLTKKVESETGDKMVWPTEDWFMTENATTVIGAICENLNHYGIAYVVPKMIEPNKALEDAVVKTVATCVADYPFEGMKTTKAERKRIAKRFAEAYALDECVLIDRGWDCPQTGKVGLLNIDWEYIGEIWDEWLADNYGNIKKAS